TRAARDVGEERCAVMLEMLEHGTGIRGQVVDPRRRCQQPRQVLAQDEGERRGTARRLDARRGRLVVAGGVAPETTPRDRARQAEPFEVRRIVARDARRQDLRLPGTRRQLEPLELTDDGEQPVAAVELRALVDVLPTEEEAHQVGGRCRLDLAAEPSERQAMDARQETALAPLFARSAGREAAAEGRALALELCGPDRYGRRREPEPLGQRDLGGRTDRLEPAADERAERVLT